MLVNEPVVVECSPHGAPVRFHWRGVPYGVTSAPEPWFSREPWWQHVDRAAKGTAVRIERELWRVDAVPLHGTGSPVDGSFDLERDQTGNWLLDHVWDDELEHRLFA
ncbi:DUF6504 family protein [Gulosibacter bifidus]|uniref:DUF6504 family protein n=1 Tax=Gulosibacter bifidus TaxID=272239 RepID=A0ABW5RK63_9MICO